MIHRYLLLCIALAAGTLAIPTQAEPNIEQSPRAVSATVTREPRAPDGTEIQNDLPLTLHTRNRGGSDGAGLCVMTSIQHSAFWQNVELLWDFQKWASQYPGGSYPSKVDRQIDQLAKQRGMQKPRYIQVETADIEVLKLACRTGRIPGVTYSYSPSGRYGGARIAHMVTLLHLDDKWACIMDNNFPQTYEWMTPSEFHRSYTGGGRTGWAVIFLDPGPPPAPKN